MKTILLILIIHIQNVLSSCTVSYADTSEQTRYAAFGVDLPLNVLSAFAPFLISAIIAFIIYNGGQRRRAE